MSIECPVPSITDVDKCFVSSIEEIRQCLSLGEVPALTQNITVDENDCDGQGVLDLTGADNLGICGQGFGIFRESGQVLCSLVYGNNVNNFFFDDIRLEETPGPDVPELGTYPHMIRLNNSQAICMQGVEVAHSWGYAVFLNGVEGFKFQSGTVRDSGVLGLYVGNGNNISTDVQIRDSEFFCNTTNALAVRGADNVIIDNNNFDDNHKLGVFPVNPQFGTGYTGGGQVYLAEGNDILFSNNTVTNGFCSNCVSAGILNNPVTGLELGLPNQASVTNLCVQGNTITNNTAYGIRLNSSSTLDSASLIKNDNVVTGNGANVQISVPAANIQP